MPTYFYADHAHTLPDMNARDCFARAVMHHWMQGKPYGIMPSTRRRVR